MSDRQAGSLRQSSPLNSGGPAGLHRQTECVAITAAAAAYLTTQALRFDLVRAKDAEQQLQSTAPTLASGSRTEPQTGRDAGSGTRPAVACEDEVAAYWAYEGSLGKWSLLRQAMSRCCGRTGLTTSRAVAQASAALIPRAQRLPSMAVADSSSCSFQCRSSTLQTRRLQLPLPRSAVDIRLRQDRHQALLWCVLLLSARSFQTPA